MREKFVQLTLILVRGIVNRFCTKTGKKKARSNRASTSSSILVTLD
jgi:hypothetical protein